MSRFAVMGTAIITVVVAVTGFVAGTWMHFMGLTGIGWEIVPVLVIGGFMPATFLGFRFRHPLLRFFIVIASVSLGFLNYGLWAAALCWIGMAASRLDGRGIEPRTLAELLYGTAVLTTLYGLANAAWLRLTRTAVSLPHLPATWCGRTVALVSDVHLGNIRGAAFVRRIVDRLNDLRPDAVFISGDMFDGAQIDIDAAVRPWAGLSAPAGVFFVGGNHDEFSDRSLYFAALRRVGIQVLTNEKVTVEGLQIVGVHDGEAGDANRFQEILRGVALDRAQASVLLAHRPSNLAIAEAAGISLQLSGHTHSGQFWPWNLIVARIYGPFAYGLHRQGGLQVYTSSGAGSWGPPLRVGTRSEIVAIRLDGAGNATGERSKPVIGSPPTERPV